MTRHRRLPILLAVLLCATPAPGAARVEEPPPPAPAFGPATAPPAGSTPEAAPPTPAGEPVEPEAGGLARALAEIRDALGLSGFFDVKAADRGTDPNVFSMGDFELDVERELGRHVQVAAALVVNDEGAELAVGFVDVHVVGAPVAPRGRLPVEKGFRAQLGRFDVPFGGDWQYFASKDRTELSAPLTTEAVLDGGYNDVGLRLLGGTGSFGWSTYWLRGEGEGSALGGRIAFTPFDNPYRLKERSRVLELGVSALHDFDGDGGTETTSFAVDAELHGPIGRLRAEWARRDERPVEGREERLVRSGLHVTALVDAGAVAGVPLTPWVRWDTAKAEPEASGGEVPAGRTKRLTAGLNALFFDVLTLKLEYQRILSAPPEVEAGEDFRRDAVLAQAVVTF
ncbi:MAG: hypothetical protein KJ062_07475 [Thermoanaerobaculia bacterium]|nr:hypothetical protein [Thermoanaerobaculia bacterium]